MDHEAGAVDLIGGLFELLAFDNKTNPQETLVQVQKAVDAGARIITQGNGSSVAIALSQWVAKHNERNPGKEVLYLNYAAVDPLLTNDKCNFWHFRWDADSDIKLEALINYIMGQLGIKKVYLINQDYSFGQSVRATAAKLLKAKRPDIQIVGDEQDLRRVSAMASQLAVVSFDQIGLTDGRDGLQVRQIAGPLRQAKLPHTRAHGAR